MPCSHAVATTYHLKARPLIDYMPKTFSGGNWVETYKADMAPFEFECFNRLTKLDSNSLHQVEGRGENELDLQSCKLPLTRIPRVRPAKNRIQKGDMRRKGTMQAMVDLVCRMFPINPRHAVASAGTQATTRLNVGNRIDRNKIRFVVVKNYPSSN